MTIPCEDGDLIYRSQQLDREGLTPEGQASLIEQAIRARGGQRSLPN